MNARLLTVVLVLFDWIASSLGWGVFYYLRKIKIERVDFSVDESFYYGIIIIPFVFILHR